MPSGGAPIAQTFVLFFLTFICATYYQLLTMLTELERAVIRYVQDSLEITPRPFLGVAQSAGVSEQEVVDCLRDLIDRGIIRRFGITLRHQLSGVDANAMGAWKVEAGDVERVGEIMASFREVTHCYERRVQRDWKYNVFTMIHGATPKDCHEVARTISEKTGITDYQLLFSERELKKTSMRYF